MTQKDTIKAPEGYKYVVVDETTVRLVKCEETFKTGDRIFINTFFGYEEYIIAYFGEINNIILICVKSGGAWTGVSKVNDWDNIKKSELDSIIGFAWRKK